MNYLRFLIVSNDFFLSALDTACAFDRNQWTLLLNPEPITICIR
jgi:hypothetical protein